MAADKRAIRQLMGTADRWQELVLAIRTVHLDPDRVVLGVSGQSLRNPRQGLGAGTMALSAREREILGLVREALSRGWTVQVVATQSALPFFDTAEIEKLTGSPVRSQYSPPGAPRSKLPEAIIVAFHEVSKESYASGGVLMADKT